MEKEWIEALERLPNAEPGALTERALDAWEREPARPRRRRALWMVPAGGLAAAGVAGAVVLHRTSPEPIPVAVATPGCCAEPTAAPAPQRLPIQRIPPRGPVAAFRIAGARPLAPTVVESKGLAGVQVAQRGEPAGVLATTPLGILAERDERAVQEVPAQRYGESDVRLQFEPGGLDVRAQPERGNRLSFGVVPPSDGADTSARFQRGLVAQRGGARPFTYSVPGLVSTARALAAGETIPMKLTPLPDAPCPVTNDYQTIETDFQRGADNRLTASVRLGDGAIRTTGVIPALWRVDAAVYDADGTLLTTASGVMPGQGGRITLDFGIHPDHAKAAHYQLVFLPKRSEEKGERMVAGYVVLSLGHKGPADPVGMPRIPEFFQSAYYKDISATVPLGDIDIKGVRTLHGVLFDSKGALLATARETFPLPRQKGSITLRFGPEGQTDAARYQLSVGRPSVQEPEPARETRQSVSLTVGKVSAGDDGSLTLERAAPDASWEEILKNPSLRDQVTVTLAPNVVAALRRTEKIDPAYWLKGKTVQASGNGTSTLYLCFPAVAVTTLTVERREDLTLIRKPTEQERTLALLPRGPYTAQPPDPVADRIQKLRAARAGGGNQSIYELCIGVEFDRVVVEAARRGDQASVAELIQQAWFGGPAAAPKGGNGITWAAYYPTAEPVKLLLAQKVAPGVADASGNTGLHRTYRQEIAELLLKAGAPREARNADGETPLIAQARQANPWTGRGIVAALLKAGAKPNALDREGRTALMRAAASGIADDVAALVAAGADRRIKDRAGKSARDYIAAWNWQGAPGLITEDGMDRLKRQAEGDRARIESLLGDR